MSLQGWPQGLGSPGASVCSVWGKFLALLWIEPCPEMAVGSGSLQQLVWWLVGCVFAQLATWPEASQTGW